jgi:hypothetical protein
VTLQLYRRENCSLCDLAETALRDAGAADVVRIGIDWTGELADRYGWRIPVLRDAADGRELDWPFDAWSVRRFVAGGVPPD